MAFSKETTTLLRPDLHRRLSRLAHEKQVSLGQLVRTACEKQYGIASRRERTAAVQALGGVSLPVGLTRPDET